MVVRRGRCVKLTTLLARPVIVNIDIGHNLLAANSILHERADKRWDKLNQVLRSTRPWPKTHP